MITIIIIINAATYTLTWFIIIIIIIIVLVYYHHHHHRYCWNILIERSFDFVLFLLLYLRCAASVFGLVAVGSAHK
jgi:hypothetical protein